MSDEKPVIAYPPEAVLEIEHVAAWLRVSPSMVEREDVPCFYVGPRRRRYLAKSVLEWMEKRAA